MDNNTDRVCESCGTDWRGSVECPTCGALDNLGGVVTICAWCQTSKALTAEAHAQGLATTHGMCAHCALTQWSDATDAYRARLAVARQPDYPEPVHPDDMGDWRAECRAINAEQARRGR